MKHILILVWGFSIAISLYAQNGATVSGRLFDESSGEALPYVSISLQTKPEQSIAAGAITDETGRFVLKGIIQGSYTVSCSFVGYQTKIMDLLVGTLNDVFDLGRIELEVLSQEIEEVSVKALRSDISANLEKMTFVMDDQIAQSGGSVLDAMRALPGITVDQDGRVILRGSDKVAVLIDGKQSSLTGFGNQKGLDNIPSANIESIEIIHNPSAKYDASGMAGIINIQYKKDKQTGFNGNVSFTYGLGVLTKRKPDLPTELGSYVYNPKYIPALNLNYRGRQFRLFLESELLSQRKLPKNEFTTRTYSDGKQLASQVPENRSQTQVILKGGIDWFINDNNTLSISGIYDYENHIDTSQVPYIDLNTMTRDRYWTWSEEEITGFMNYVLDYGHKFTQAGHELNAGFQYTKGWEDETYFMHDSSEIRQSRDTTNILATEHTFNFVLDYIKPLRSGRFEAGSKIQIRRIPVEYTTGKGNLSIIYPGLGDWSNWGENIYAAYFNYVFERPVFDVEAGLRMEYTGIFYNIDPANIYYQENDAYDYFKLYPSVRFTFKSNSNHHLSAFYNRRVDRPGEPELRIFPKYDDPELLKVGNPYLRPQFTQTFELAYKYKWSSGSLFLSGYYRLIENPFLRIYSADTTNTQYNIINKIYQNVGDARNGGIELVMSQTLFDIWKISGSMNYYKNIIHEHEGQLLFPYERPFVIRHSSDYTWDIKFTNQIHLPGELEFQLTMLYYAPKNTPQGRERSRSSVDFGMKKKVLKEKGEIIFSFSDLFNRFGTREEITTDEFTAVYENIYETQVIRLGFSYKF